MCGWMRRVAVRPPEKDRGEMKNGVKTDGEMTRTWFKRISRRLQPEPEPVK